MTLDKVKQVEIASTDDIILKQKISLENYTFKLNTKDSNGVQVFMHIIHQSPLFWCERELA